LITITIQIGNTDNKLTQQAWSEYVEEVGDICKEFSTETHFFGGPNNWERWQNVAWIFEMCPNRVNQLSSQLEICRRRYLQDSIALTAGETSFV